jgi:hypothetical protein
VKNITLCRNTDCLHLLCRWNPVSYRKQCFILSVFKEVLVATTSHINQCFVQVLHVIPNKTAKCFKTTENAQELKKMEPEKIWEKILKSFT